MWKRLKRLFTRKSNSTNNDSKKYGVWYRHSGQPEIDSIPESPYIKHMTTTEILEDVSNHTITHMYIGFSNIPEEMFDIAPNLKALRLERIPDIAEQINRLRTLQNLQELYVSRNAFWDGLPEGIYELHSLVKLDISDCNIATLDSRLRALSRLNELNVSSNPLSEGVPEVIFELTNLSKLDVSQCELVSLDDQLSKLNKLKELNVSWNNFPTGLPSIVYELSSLQRLDVSSCGLTTLYAKLSQLEQLEALHLGNDQFRPTNNFTALPAVIMKLETLRTLTLSHLPSLLELEHGLIKLPHMKELECEACYSLRSPPYSVCAQGYQAIQKYYKDLAERAGFNIPVILAAVVGDWMAGKTSLVRSLRDKKRVLTTRDDAAEEDDTTKVFEVTEVSLEESSLRMYDFGGDRIYHIAYQLTIRSNYIAIMVVNIEAYYTQSRQSGCKDAARRLCMDYLAHLYIPCPQLGAPILVLTHTDRLSSNELGTTMSELLIALESLRTEMLDEERQLPRKSHSLSEILHFKGEHIFHPDDIFLFSNDLIDDTQILALLRHLAIRCKNHIVNIPFLWEQIGLYMNQKQNVPFLNLNDIMAKFPQRDNLVVLRHKHNEGQILWFEREPALRHLVFHRVSQLTKVIAVLFHHRNEKLWKQRIELFEPFLTKDGKWIAKEKYTSLVQDFLKSGVIDEAVLSGLYNNADFPRDVAISILQTFFLVCGPIKSPLGSSYIIPYLSPDVINISPAAPGLVRLCAGLMFVGLSPASFVYQLMVVAYLNLHNNPGYRIRAAQNGAVVHHGQTVSRLLHDHSSREVALLVDTPVSQLDTSWAKVFEILEAILQQLKTKWASARVLCKFSCAHCIYKGEEDVDCEVDPSWYTPPIYSDQPLAARLTDLCIWSSK